MLMVTTTTRDGSESFDLHDLPIGETKAHLLTAAELYERMAALEIADIHNRMGWQALALIYARWFNQKGKMKYRTTPVEVTKLRAGPQERSLPVSKKP
jgi:hypothetical protein